jgi:hypothetical protein
MKFLSFLLQKQDLRLELFTRKNGSKVDAAGRFREHNAAAG